MASSASPFPAAYSFCAANKDPKMNSPQKRKYHSAKCSIEGSNTQQDT